VAAELFVPAVIPGPVQVYVTGLAVVDATTVVEVTWQFKLLLAVAVTDGTPELCVTETDPTAVQLLVPLVTV
jgi:hypothetical protein